MKTTLTAGILIIGAAGWVLATGDNGETPSRSGRRAGSAIQAGGESSQPAVDGQETRRRRPEETRRRAGGSRFDGEAKLGRKAILSEARRQRLAALRGQALSAQSTGASMPGAGTLGRRRQIGGTEPGVTAPLQSATPSLTTDGQVHLGGDLFKDGSPLLWTDAGTYNMGVGYDATVATADKGNTGVGHQAGNTSNLRNTSVGAWSGRTSNFYDTTSVGYAASYFNNGINNVAVGSYAGYMTVNSLGNTTVGMGSMYYNYRVYYNTMVGYQTMVGAIGGAYPDTLNGNSGFGAWALTANTSGAYNTAVGMSAGVRISTGSYNTMVGYYSGYNVTTGDDNIMIGSLGVNGDAGKIRIGDSAYQTATYIAGIKGKSVGAGEAQVLIDNNGKLGTLSSSRRYKESIEDMGDASARLLALRPVTFRFKKAFEGGEKPLQFGLIAEEVAEVFPELVIFDDQGRPETVKYHLLVTLLLNEFQKQAVSMEGQARINTRQEADLAELRALRAEVAELRQLTQRLAGVEAGETPVPASRGQSLSDAG